MSRRISSCRRRSNIGASGDVIKKELATEPMEVDDVPNKSSGVFTAIEPITCVEFSPNGQLLAAGDKSGNISILRQEENCNHSDGIRECSYSVYSSFQSHQPEFDYLKSAEIEGKINQVKWLSKNSAHFLISANDKTVKLWKVAEKRKVVEQVNLSPISKNIALNPQILFPRSATKKSGTIAKLQKIYSNGHTYHINSLSANSDQETFLSSDDLRINIWHQEITNQSFNVVDKKPVRMEELTEVITKAEFHPSSCNLFAYATSQGSLRVCDMRSSALCDSSAKTFEVKRYSTPRSFFSEIVSAVSDVKFSRNGQYLLTRDYLTIKVWDMHMESAPVETYRIHDYLQNKMCDLYESDTIFDKFECSWNGNDSQIVTGSYNNFFRITKRNAPDESITYEVGTCRAICRPVYSSSFALRSRRLDGPPGKKRKDEVDVNQLNFNQKMLHCSWNPSQNMVAAVSANSLYVFEGF